MDQKLYYKLKKALTKYDFDQPRTSFGDLHKQSKKYLGHYMSFKEFVGHMKTMGVNSRVRRLEPGISRGLVYDPKADQYLLNVFPVLDRCPACKGTGVVQIDLSGKQ